MYRLLATFLALLAPLCLVAAQDKDAAGAKEAAGISRGGDASRPPMAVTPEREAAVMTFVERNHAALKEVLASLKTSRPKEYDKAIREIYQTSERLASVKERDPKLYDLELENWTLRSRIQLLTARMVMASSDEIRSQLRELLNRQMDVRAEVLKLERQRAEERLKRIENDLAKVQSNREQHIERQLDLLMRSAEASKSKNRTSGKTGQTRPAGKKNKSTVNQPAKAKANQSRSP